MPVVPVLPNVPGLDGWSLWKSGRISAANVTWSVDASDSDRQQNYLLAQLAVDKGYNAIRLVLSPGSAETAWDDMLLIASEGWDSTSTLSAASGAQPINEISAHIDTILNTCAQLGLGVIFDVHDFLQRNTDDGAIGPLWVDTDATAIAISAASSFRDALVDLWDKTVQRWPVATYPAIIGFEILNEPNPDPSLSFTQMQAGDDNNWYKLADRCIKAIRKYDATTPIIVDGIYYADAYGLKYFDPTSGGGPGLLHDYQLNSSSFKSSYADYRIVYSFHVYGPYDFTHQGVVESTYESQGLPYPLNYVEPYGSAGYANAARMRMTVYDGSTAAVTAHGSSVQTLYLPFLTSSDLVVRNQPAIDFQAHATSAQGGVVVPIFVGEFSAANPALIQSARIATTSPRRAITKIEVLTGGWAKVTLGNLSGGFNINFYPQYENNSGSAPGYGGAYSDYAKASISDSTDSAFNISYALQVRLEQGSTTIEKRSVGSVNLGLYYDSSMAGRMLYNGGAQVATLNLAPGLYAKSFGDQCRAKYAQDVLKMCLAQGFSWAYWQEDGYVANESTINNTKYAGIFVGWRPSSLTANLLTLVATRRTVSTS